MEGKEEKKGYNTLAIVGSILAMPPVIICASAFLFILFGVPLFPFLTKTLPLDNLLSEIAIFFGFPIASLTLGIMGHRQIASTGEKGKIVSVIVITFGTLFILFTLFASLRAS